MSKQLRLREKKITCKEKEKMMESVAVEDVLMNKNQIIK